MPLKVVGPGGLHGPGGLRGPGGLNDPDLDHSDQPSMGGPRWWSGSRGAAARACQRNTAHFCAHPQVPRTCDPRASYGHVGTCGVAAVQEQSILGVHVRHVGLRVRAPFRQQREPTAANEARVRPNVRHVARSVGRWPAGPPVDPLPGRPRRWPIASCLEWSNQISDLEE